jgi:CRISPR type IV-associated protein Csf3
MDYSNLRIRAYLRSPVVADPWLPLDGVLLAQATRRDLGERAATVPGASALAAPKGEAMRGGRLPLAHVHAKDWYYKCSWAVWGPCADGQDYWSKRFDMTHASLVDFRGRRGKIDTSSGGYKAYRMPVYYRAALWVEWYCVGDAAQLAPLVYMTTHLGKKTSQGWGSVARWEIEPAGADWSIWREGKLMRGIPRYHWPREQGEPQVGLYGIRPSYWDQRNQMELVLP